MHKSLILAALLLAAPVAAQTPPATGHGEMTGMNHGTQAKAMDHANMHGMDHSKGGMGDKGGMGEMMKNTPANPYAEAGMAMHHKMMVVGADPSETWVRQMIEHHRGAIAMSKIAVTQASDKDVRAMAQSDIAMQEKDLAKLQSWLKSKGKAAQ